ncbi:hypothetical protein [Pseudarthrobacter sp. PS3-L1]|nr:hypothetical protein [Pseudarthrobacter sp. PS3-L1]MDJ0319403.1 hypothetical protein [Pseudarthrobacter sp. PS3-L1]
MKKILASVLVAGAIVGAGLSATTAISASAESTDTSTVAVGWWPNSIGKF